MKKQILYINKKLENEDLNVINKNIISLILLLKNNEKHMSRLDYDIRKIKESTRGNEQ